MVAQGQEYGIERQEDMHLNVGKYLCLQRGCLFLCANSSNRKISKGTELTGCVLLFPSREKHHYSGFFWRGWAKSKILFTLTTYHFSSSEMVVTRVFEVCWFER